MTKIIELRERLRTFYGKFEIYLKPGGRFLLACVAFFMINGSIGYMKRLDSPAVALILALVCAFLPVNAVAVLAVLLILVHLYALSLEACVVVLLLFLLMFFMYFKFAPKNGCNVVLTSILCRLQIPQVMPMGLGLVREPYSALSMTCGIITFYLLKGIRENETMFGALETEEEAISKFTMTLQQLLGNKEMYLTIGAFALTTIIVYVIRRLSIDHAWTIAIGVGTAVNLIVQLTGSFMLGFTDHVLWIVIGTAVSAVAAFILEFFLYNLDYSRVERVQFEDDEYYYYVKAIPKVFVPAKDKKVKRINKAQKVTINKRELAEELDIDQDLLDD